MNRYIVINGELDDMTYYIIQADDMSEALDRFEQYAQENDIDLDIGGPIARPFDNDAIVVKIG